MLFFLGKMRSHNSKLQYRAVSKLVFFCDLCNHADFENSHILKIFAVHVGSTQKKREMPKMSSCHFECCCESITDEEINY